MSSVKERLKEVIEEEERRTVGDAFGGPSTRRGSFSTRNVLASLLEATLAYPAEEVSQLISAITRKIDHAPPNQNVGRDLLAALIRFAFLIELTNHAVSSTKFKTRWVPVPLVSNESSIYVANKMFEPGHDPRAASYDDCFDIFLLSLATLNDDASARAQAIALLRTRRAYSFFYTYVDPHAPQIHVRTNVRLAPYGDRAWLNAAEPLIYDALPDAIGTKIRTKAYLTDRAQTGPTQTNRAKRWEVHPDDYQHASLEECWSVERALLSSLADFVGFPADTRDELVRLNLVPKDSTAPSCPISLLPMNFTEFLTGGPHGQSEFHVGHLTPLKAGGRHVGSNVAWISRDGNRIQGSMSIQDVHTLLRGIVGRLPQA